MLRREDKRGQKRLSLEKWLYCSERKGVSKEKKCIRKAEKKDVSSWGLV